MQEVTMNKTEQPLISVIMSVYNGAQFLRKAMDSVLCQTYTHFEFIICDDGSTDESVAILAEYAQKDERIRLIRNETNIGLAASLNKCLSQAQGAYIARMDCDDRALPKRFQAQVHWLEDHPEVCALGCAVEYIDDHGRAFACSNIPTDRFYTMEYVVRRCVMVHPSVMMRKEPVLAVGGYSVNELTTRAEDYDLWCKLCEQGGIVANTREVLFQYREDDSNIVHRQYKYRIQEFRLKWHWIRRAKRPFYELIYAIRPLLVGLLPLGLYKVLHRKKLTGF